MDLPGGTGTAEEPDRTERAADLLLCKRAVPLPFLAGSVPPGSQQPVSGRHRPSVRGLQALAFRWSSRNCCNPMSVKGWLTIASIVFSGQVTTSAPLLAASVICRG
ncbi:MAG: hypothetical protein RLY31_378 [Bacteroidota bacterium]